MNENFWEFVADLPLELKDEDEFRKMQAQDWSDDEDYENQLLEIYEDEKFKKID